MSLLHLFLPCSSCTEIAVAMSVVCLTMYCYGSVIENLRVLGFYSGGGRMLSETL